MRKNRKEKGGQLANYYPKLYCGSGFSAFPENGNPAESGIKKFFFEFSG